MAIETTSDLSSVVSSQIVDGAVTSAKIGTGAVVAASIAAGVVGSAALADNAVVAAKIAAGSVGSAALASGAVGSAAIFAGSINSTHIGANAVVSGDIAAGAVDSAALASGAVVSASIAAGAVGSAALASNAVVAAKIAASAVGVVAISSGTATSGTLLTADGSGGASFSAAPAGGGMVLISSVSATSGATSNIGFVDIPQTYTVLRLIGQFYVTAAGEHYIQINPSTSTSAIGGTTGFASKIFHISKTSDNSVTTFSTGNNNMEGTEVSSWFLTIPNLQSRYANVSVEISNYRALGPIGIIGLLSQQNAGRFVGFTWGEARNSPPAMKTLWVSGNFNLAIFRLYGS